MKKLQIILIIMCLCCVFSGCDKDKSTKATATSKPVSVEKKITSSDIRQYVPSSLLSLLKDGYYPKNVDLMQTRYEIGTIEWDNDNDFWMAYGRYTIYEKSGSMYENGSFSLAFMDDGRFNSSYSRTYDKFKY